VRRALPEATQVADRWHLWHNLGEAVLKEVAAHSVGWAKATAPQYGPRAQTTRERWHQVHTLLDPEVGLRECARRLNLSPNIVKRHARASEPERLQRAPQYRPTLVDSYREHLRRRRNEEPGIGPLQLFQEIKAMGYQVSLSLLYRYITQGRVEGDGPPMSPRRLPASCSPGPASLFACRGLLRSRRARTAGPTRRHLLERVRRFYLVSVDGQPQG
jgi:hypothetical protein